MLKLNCTIYSNMPIRGFNTILTNTITDAIHMRLPMTRIYLSGIEDGKASVPYGYSNTNAIIMPLAGGEITALTTLAGLASLTLGIKGYTALTHTSSINGVASDVLNISGKSTLTATAAGTSLEVLDIHAYAEAVSALAGSSSLQLDISSLLNAFATIAGTSTETLDITSLTTLSSTILGTSTVDGTAQALVDILASIQGTSSTALNVEGYSELAMSTFGTSTFTVSISSLASVLASLAGSSSVSSSVKGSIWIYMNQILSTASLTSNIHAHGGMDLGLTIGTGATPEEVANAVLNTTDGVESGMTVKEALRIILAVAAGKTGIIDLGGGAATVTFRDTQDTKARVTATMTGSERTDVTLDKT